MSFCAAVDCIKEVSKCILSWKSGVFSYPKPTKEVNEDFLLLPTYDLESNIIFAIADGVSSSSSADKASECY